MTVAVVGPGSLVAGALRRARASAGWRFVRWQDAVAADDWLDGVSCVVNCAYDPRLRAGAPYDPALDVDLRIARRVSARPGTLQLMLSTRAAYGPAGADPVLREDRPPAPDRPYGASKLATERALGALLGERLTVLRLSNVFGDEAVPGRRTFVGVALATLRERGAIVLDIDPGVARDFVPVEAVADAIARVVAAPRPGVFNVGSGVGTPVGAIARADRRLRRRTDRRDRPTPPRRVRARPRRGGGRVRHRAARARDDPRAMRGDRARVAGPGPGRRGSRPAVGTVDPAGVGLRQEERR